MARIYCRNLFCFILLILLSVSAAWPAFANPDSELEEKRREREEIQRELEEERRNLQQQRSRELSLNQELAQLNRRLEALQAEKERLAAEIQRTEQDIVVAEEELAEAEEQLLRQSDLLDRRIRVIHEQGSVTYLEVLLDANSFGDFLTRLFNLKMIASNDLRLVEENRAERDRIQKIKEELEQKKINLENMRHQTLANEAEIEAAAEAREQVLVELQAEIARNIQAIQDLENEADNLARLIASLISGNPGSGPVGQLHWPIEPPYWPSSPFGWRRCPLGIMPPWVLAWHGGLDLATFGRDVNHILAADGGRVIFSGWKGAYGNCIMIDHGNGLVTAYGHMSRLLVSRGDWVEKGQRIARVGTTGETRDGRPTSTGIHLHFEVWDYNREPLRSAFPNDRRHNPMDYL